jgi:glycosyltransferase involved in cell wall biosynthesis
MLLATSWSRGRFRRIFWSEAHADAVLHPRGVVAGIRRRVLALFDAYAVPNGRSAEFLASELGRPVQPLPLANCVDEGYFGAPRPAAAAALREALGIRTTRRLAAVVARAVVRKGGGHLLDAYAAIPAKTRRTLALAFAGSGPETGRWAERARGIPDGEVHFLGERSASDVRALLWSADAFVLPSIVDPNPLSAIEAAFTGTPLLLSTRAGNCDELIEPGRTGFSFDPLEPGSLSAALCALAALSPDALSAMGEAARAVAARSFSRREIARTFCDRLLGTPDGARDG